MTNQLTPEEVATLIRARQISKAKGLEPDASVKTICQTAGISRKTGYQWTERYGDTSAQIENELRAKLMNLKTEHENLEKKFDDLRFENEGRKIAWEIYGCDSLVEKKNNSIPRRKKKQ